MPSITATAAALASVAPNTSAGLTTPVAAPACSDTCILNDGQMRSRAPPQSRHPARSPTLRHARATVDARPPATLTPRRSSTTQVREDGGDRRCITARCADGLCKLGPP